MTPQNLHMDVNLKLLYSMLFRFFFSSPPYPCHVMSCQHGCKCVVWGLHILTVFLTFTLRTDVELFICTGVDILPYPSPSNTSHISRFWSLKVLFRVKAQKPKKRVFGGRNEANEEDNILAFVKFQKGPKFIISHALAPQFSQRSFDKFRD